MSQLMFSRLCLAASLAFLVPALGAGQVQKEAPAIAQARKAQTASGYVVDAWKMTTLKKGQVVYAGVPGQAEFYTNKKATDASGLSATKLFKSLQVKPHAQFGYRTRVQEFVLQRDVEVPTCKALANPAFGAGGSDQYYIKDFDKVLKPGKVLDLGK
jgi:hypothetical protein